MAKSRKRKGHAKRLAKRNLEKQHQKNRQQKEINKMIEQYKTMLEQEAKKNTEDKDEDIIDSVTTETEDITFDDTTGFTHIDGRKYVPESEDNTEDKDIINSVTPESEDTK